MVEKNKVLVKIDGREYYLIGPEAEEYMVRLGVFVDKKVQEVQGQAGFSTISTTDAAVLAALNIADELLKLRDEHALMDERIAKLIDENNQVSKQPGSRKNQYSSNKTRLESH